jgi:hypothetical protein
MDSKKYIGMDVHKESISIAVMNGAGKIVMECVIETKASMILQFIESITAARVLILRFAGTLRLQLQAEPTRLQYGILRTVLCTGISLVAPLQNRRVE